jgi:hypothetical protein
MKKLLKFTLDVALVASLLFLANKYLPQDTLSTPQIKMKTVTRTIYKVKKCKPIIRVIEKTIRITKTHNNVRVQIARITKGN